MYLDRLLPRAAEGLLDYINGVDPVRLFLTALSLTLLLIAIYQLIVVQRMLGRLRNGKRFWWKRGTMSSELLEREMVADAVTNALEELYFQNKITLRARNRWYACIGKAHKLGDLMPRKRKVKKNTGYATYLKNKAATGLEQLKKLSPYPIPGPKPGEDAYVKPPRKRGALFSKVRA